MHTQTHNRFTNHNNTHTNTNKSQLIRLTHTTLFNPHYTVTPNGHRQGANGRHTLFTLQSCDLLLPLQLVPTSAAARPAVCDLLLHVCQSVAARPPIYCSEVKPICCASSRPWFVVVATDLLLQGPSLQLEFSGLCFEFEAFMFHGI